MHQSDGIKIRIIFVFNPSMCSVGNESWEFTFPTMDEISRIHIPVLLEICAFCLSSMAPFLLLTPHPSPTPPPNLIPFIPFLRQLLSLPSNFDTRRTPCLLWVAISTQSIFYKMSEQQTKFVNI